jgi:vanillate O-demethylase monooxygenase subunit
MLARKILNEQIVLFRKTDGAVVALQDRCAYRFVPPHGQYLHPLFKNPAGPSTLEADTANDPGTIWAKFVRQNQYTNEYFQMLGYPRDQRGDHRNYMRWNPPGVLLLDVGMTSVGGSPSAGISIPTSHLLTLETLTSTHYFWGMARNFRLDYESFSEQLLVTGMTVFNDEDKPVIEAQQRAIGASDKLFDMKPALLQTDRAAVRARRMLERMIRQETGGMFDSSAIDIERP